MDWGAAQDRRGGRVGRRTLDARLEDNVGHPEAARRGGAREALLARGSHHLGDEPGTRAAPAGDLDRADAAPVVHADCPDRVDAIEVGVED